ncbi:hypothetical protein C8F01DRAFT_1286370 [Mycena amicta]|nr:hypothetical protein C8F01DRAFT_1286370 [Mycena amicta]
MSLLTPLKIGSVTIVNRVGMSALTRNRSTKTVPNDIMCEYYTQRAEGGAGLIVGEGVLITRQGTEWQAAPGIWEQSQIDGWKKIVDSVHAAGSKIYAQVWHLGRVSHPDAPEQIAAGVPVYGPSAISARGGKFRFLPGRPGYVTPTELPDPKIIIAQFKQAAMNAKQAGFDGVELHGANGYIVHQFLDSTSNHRTDAYGGSPANRVRFTLETLAALQEVYGQDVSIKLTPTGGYNDMGMPLDETIATFGLLLEEIEKLPVPLSYVTLVRYTEWMDPEIEGKLRGYLASGRTALFLNSGLQPAEAEELISSGKVAGVFFGTLWLTHPDLTKRIKAGKPLDNVPDLYHFYVADDDPAVGYTDYKAAVY